MATPGIKSAKRIEIAQRRTRVADLIKSGLSNRAIAAQLGCDEGTVRGDVKNVLAHLSEETAARAPGARDVMLAQLDDIFIPAHTKASAADGNDNAALTCVRIMERRAKLLGLDAPVKQDVTQHGDVPTFVFNNVAPPTEPEPETESVSDATPTESETNG